MAGKCFNLIFFVTAPIALVTIEIKETQFTVTKCVYFSNMTIEQKSMG